MTQKRLDRTNQEMLDLALAKIDGNFDDVFDIMQVLDVAFTLASQTGAQAMFNGSPNGALNLPAGLYEFECQFALSVLSATSGAFGFALGGGATIESQAWQANAIKAALATAAAGAMSYNTAANVLIAAATTNTVGWAYISGVFRLSVGGTVIPQLSQTTASAAVVAKNSYFRAKKLSQAFAAAVISPPQPNPSGISWS